MTRQLSGKEVSECPLVAGFIVKYGHVYKCALVPLFPGLLFLQCYLSTYLACTVHFCGIQHVQCSYFLQIYYFADI